MLNKPITESQRYINNLWLERCGFQTEQKETINLEELRKSEWSDEFEHLMRNRLVLGALRYGKIGKKNKPKYDRTKAIQNRLKNYIETGNKEMLVDVANLALLEFVECDHPKQHFKSDESIEHVKER